MPKTAEVPSATKALASPSNTFISESLPPHQFVPLAAAGLIDSGADQRERSARKSLLERSAWGKERRICQTVRLRRDGGTLLVGNLHATSSPDKRLPDVELLRAAVFVDGLAQPGEPVLLCGDFNVTVQTSRTLAELMTSEWGFTGALRVGIDQILVRGLAAGEPHEWPPERRAHDGKLLSDHTPVEVEVE